MTEDALVYSFSLVYSPTPIGNTVILKTNPAEVLIECHYQRYAQLPPHRPPTKKKYQLVSACHPCCCTGDVSHPNPFAELQKPRCNLPNRLEKLLPVVTGTSLLCVEWGFSCHTATEIVQGTLCSTHHQKGVL